MWDPPPPKGVLSCKTEPPPTPPLCDIPSRCCFILGPWAVTLSSLCCVGSRCSDGCCGLCSLCPPRLPPPAPVGAVNASGDARCGTPAPSAHVLWYVTHRLNHKARHTKRIPGRRAVAPWRARRPRSPPPHLCGRCTEAPPLNGDRGSEASRRMSVAGGREAVGSCGAATGGPCRPGGSGGWARVGDAGAWEGGGDRSPGGRNGRTSDRPDWPNICRVTSALRDLRAGARVRHRGNLYPP